jgi:hypothetical protein
VSAAIGRLTEGRHYKIDQETGCWEWLLYRDPDGYGRALRGGPAHRQSFIEAGNELPKGQPLDHLCRNRGCVNPEHLELVTIAENTRRSFIARGFGPDRKTCGKGHDITDAYVEPTTGKRKCRTCRREWALAWYYRQKVAS